MFKLSVSGTYFARVDVDLPGGGKASFDAQFRRLSQSEMDSLGARLKEGALDDQELVDDVLVGWIGVAGEDGEALEFNETNKQRVLDIVPVRACVLRAFFESFSKARGKN